MMHLKFTYVLLGLLSLFLIQSFAADYPNMAKLSAQYKKYNAVISNMNTSYVIDWVDDSVQITQHNVKELVILNDFYKGLAKDYIFLGSFTTIQDKEAYTLVPKGNGFEQIAVRQFHEKHPMDGGIFYDDSKLLEFTYPALQKGAVTHLNYSIRYNNPKLLDPCYLQSFIPIVKGKITVKVHKNIELGFKDFNFDGIQPLFKTYKKGKYNYYEWAVEDVPPYAYYSDGFYSPSYFSPHLTFYIERVKDVPFFGTQDQLYTFYRGFIHQIDTTGVDSLKTMVNKITEGLVGKQERARAIYYWVHKNIKYIAYEEGYAGFVPTSAKDVLAKRFGDCKGMSCLIKTMMDLADIPTYYTWVGTRHKPYGYAELPLPLVDNHMIAAQIVGDSVLWLDGTFEYLDYGVSPYHIQGKEAMIGISDDKYEIYKIPISPASYSEAIDSVKIQLRDGKVWGHDNIWYSGFNKLELAHTFGGVKPDNYNRLLSQFFAMGNNKFMVTDHQVCNLFEYNQPARVQFDFEISDYYKSIGDELYLNLNLDRSYGQMTIDTTSSTFTPLENDFYCTKRYVIELEIPEGYEVTYVPKATGFANEDFSFSMKYTFNEKSVMLEKELKFEFLILLEDKIQAWNQMIKSLNKSYRNTLVLKRIK